MIKELKFVQGAVAKKDFAPALTHFRINNRQIRGFNGQLAICAPIDVDLDIAPKAAQFVKAIAACEETIALHFDAKTKKLVVRSGSFRAHVECVDPSSYPDIKPSGKLIELPDSLLPALKYLEPFIAEDASRPWACGILFDGQFASATNNIVVMQYWLGFEFPGRVNIPGFAVRELIRVGERPTHLQVEPNRIIFHYEDGKWVSTQLFEDKWPDIGTILNRFLDAETEPFPAGFWEGLEQLLPFCDEVGRCYLLGDRMATGATPELSGASVALVCPSAGIFNARHLAKLKGLAERIGFAAYPQPVPFFGERCRGVISGIRQ